jgi:O-antigen/teichoic acid export membrane protein
MVIACIGIAALDAAITYDAAKGVDRVLRSFAQSLFGPWLLILVALGLIAFGVLSFVEAKWRRTPGGVPVWVKVYSSPEWGWVSRLRPSWPALHG